MHLCAHCCIQFSIYIDSYALTWIHIFRLVYFHFEFNVCITSPSQTSTFSHAFCLSFLHLQNVGDCCCQQLDRICWLHLIQCPGQCYKEISWPHNSTNMIYNIFVPFYSLLCCFCSIPFFLKPQLSLVFHKRLYSYKIFAAKKSRTLQELVIFNSE